MRFREEIIVKHTAILLLLFTTLASSAFGQFPQMRTVDERINQKTEQINRAEAERRQLEANEKGSLPAFYPSVMNVDVQLALTKLEYKNFAEAKPNMATQIADGDSAWLFVKFNGKVQKYVYTLRNADGTERYLIFVEYGPQGDSTAKSHSILEFRKDELTATELKLSLSPGKAGNNNSLAIFIKNIAASKPGRWNNELRFTNNPSFPRGINDYLAKTAFVADFTKGFTKYPRMLSTFDSMVLRDTTDETKLPIEGKFDDTLVRTALVQKIAGEGIAPSRVYFSGDNWLEYSDLPISQRQFRTVTGVFQYQNGTSCLYGTATITQPYIVMDDRYGESTITLKTDLPTPCVTAK